MCAYLRVEGETFDVDRFLDDSTIKPDLVFHRGEPKKRLKGKNWMCNGFGIEIGGAFGRLDPQTTEVIKFFGEHRQELARLSHFAGVSDMRLIFSYCPGSCANVTEYFSPAVLGSLGSIGVGIELDIYPGDDEWIEEEDSDEDPDGE
jgi:hypothetical protein